jgi:hypothetical protein
VILFGVDAPAQPFVRSAPAVATARGMDPMAAKILGRKDPKAKVADKGAVTRKMFAILGRGNAVQVRNRDTGVTKVVTTWNPRADGELKAATTSGKSDYVDIYRSAYDITEVPMR